MKKYIILILITLWAFVDAKAQSNYLLSGTVDNVAIVVQNTSYSGGGYRGTTRATTDQELWYVTPAASLNGNPIQEGNLQVILTNNKTSWVKMSLYDFTGTNLIRTQNIAPGADLIMGRFNGVGVPYTTGDFPLDASKDYYWKFETVSTQVPICVNDTRITTKITKIDLYVLFNDLNMPSNQTPVRVKAGQTITGLNIVSKGSYFEITSGSTEGSFSFIYEAYSQSISGSDIVYGEATATVTVSGINQYCELSILSEKLVVGSNTIHEFTLASPNTGINPFNYTVYAVNGDNLLLSGTTPPATSNKETIDFGNLPTGTYSVVFRSSTANCFASRVVPHINISNLCNITIPSIDKISGTNNYKANVLYSNTTSLKSYIISTGSTPLLPKTNIVGNSFDINMATLPQGTYTLNIENEGANICKAQKSFDHTLVVFTTGGTKLETWTKYIHGYKDNWIISGKTDNASGRDNFGQVSFPERANNVVWKTFISDFENEGGSPLAKAIVGFRKDTNRNEVGISVAVTPNSIILQQRTSKSGATNVLATVNNITTPVWVRLTKTGNNLVADFSKDLTMTPVYQELGRVNGVFSGWSNYQKYIGVASAKTDVIATARFQGQLGGNVNFASPTVSINTPVVASNILTPTNGQSVTLSTTTACIAPSTNKWYKNNETTSFSAGASVNVQAYHTDSYYARCENGLNKSAKSNNVLFAISNLPSCNNGTQPFSVASAVFSNGSISFLFDAQNLTNANWSVLNGSTVVKTGNITPSSNTITVPAGSIPSGNYMFKLDGVACNGTAQKSFIVAGASSNPTVSSLPSFPVSGSNITMTATGCVGNYNWYASGVSQPYATNSGNLTVQNVIGGTYYYATCIGSNVPSNYVNISASNGVTITEPNKPQYFFSNNQAPSFYSNRANLPAIFTNTATFDAINDVVYLENQYLKIGLNLKRGGQICYASVAGSTDNKVYNGYDGGFQWVLDATQNLVGGIIQGQTSGSPQNNINYNTTMGGDYLNHSQTLIDYRAVQNGYYIKFRPLLYPFNGIISETEIEATYTLVGKSLKVDYTYTSFRTDPTVESNSTSIQGFAIPILFMTNDLTNYSAYTGSQPWTNGALTEGEIPNVTGGANLPFGVDAKEFWAVTYNPNNNFAVGAMNIAEGGYVRWEQLNKYQGNPAGTVFNGPYTTLSLLANVVIPNGRSFQKSFSSFITLGNKSAVIEELRTRAGH